MTLTCPCPLCRRGVTLTLPGSSEADATRLVGRVVCVECAQAPRPASPLPPGRAETSPAMLTLAAILNAATAQRDAATGIVGDGSGDLAH